jgi:hypothetical protein
MTRHGLYPHGVVPSAVFWADSTLVSKFVQLTMNGEDISDTILRLIELRERTEFVKRQKQIAEAEDFLPLD